MKRGRIRQLLIDKLRKPFVYESDWYERLPVVGFTVAQEQYDAVCKENEELKQQLEDAKEEIETLVWQIDY